jgi:glucokinase-like ROK family protein
MRKQSTRDIRRSNQLSVLKSIYATGSISRQQIAEETGLSTATVANVVTDLLNYGIVIESGFEESQGGRPRAILTAHTTNGYLVGIDVAETYIHFDLFDLGLNLCHATQHALNSAENRPAQIAAHITNGLDELLEQLRVPQEKVLGVGVSMPGPVDPRSGVSIFAPNWGWHDVPLLAMLKEQIDLRIYLDNPLKALALAELWFGSGRGAANLVAVNLGTGVGAGVVVDGALYRGASNCAGEWGHTNIAIDGWECRCGSHGCVEAYIGAPGIIRMIREIAPQSSLLQQDDQTATITALADALHRDDPVARQVLGEAVRYLGPAIANLINMFNPQVVVIGGWVSDKLGAYLLPELNRVVPRYVLRRALEATTIQICQLRYNPVSVGAATFALTGFLSSAERGTAIAGLINPSSSVASTPTAAQS